MLPSLLQSVAELALARVMVMVSLHVGWVDRKSGDSVTRSCVSCILCCWCWVCLEVLLG